MASKYLISICITSYKRLNELDRCLNSIDSHYVDDVEIVVSEDHSPEKENIEKLVKAFSETSPYHVVFNSNEQNLGYDRNLKKLMTLANGQYIFYLSDDDCLYKGALDKLIDFIRQSNAKYSLIYSPFWYGPVNDSRRKYASSFAIEKGAASAGKYVYDSILFSGLVFRKDSICKLDAERFKNLNYFQVYMFLHVMYHYGAYYLDVMTINSVSDGENAYGTVESSRGGSNKQQVNYLADRNSIFSNLEFNKGLFKAIKLFDADNGTTVFNVFSKEYSLRTFGGLCRARKQGISTYREYWNRLRELDISYAPVTYLYYFILLVLGADMSQVLVRMPRYILEKARGNK